MLEPAQVDQLSIIAMAGEAEQQQQQQLPPGMCIRRSGLLRAGRQHSLWACLPAAVSRVGYAADAWAHPPPPQVCVPAGATSEAMKYDEVIGQNADMFDLQVSREGLPGMAAQRVLVELASTALAPADQHDLHLKRHLTPCRPSPPLPPRLPPLLQRIMSRSGTKMGNSEQQNQTRWACYQAASLLRKYSKEYEALQAAMQSGGSVVDCLKAIEAA